MNSFRVQYLIKFRRANMQYLVHKKVGKNVYIGKKTSNKDGGNFVVFKSAKEMFVGVESYTYDEKSNSLIWEGIADLGLKIVGFTATENEAIEMAGC